MKKVILYLLVLLVNIWLVACSKTKMSMPDNGCINKEVEQQLISSAQSIERSLASLAMEQESNNPPILNTAPLVTPEGGMGGTATIDWTGPIEPLVNKLANLCGYTVKVFGNEPAIPIIVSITQNMAAIADILKNAGLQAGKRVNIMVFPANKIIELRYNTG